MAAPWNEGAPREEGAGGSAARGGASGDGVPTSLPMAAMACGGVHTQECGGEFKIANFAAACATTKTISEERQECREIGSGPLLVAGGYQFGLVVVWSVNAQGGIDSDSKFGVYVRRHDSVDSDCTVLLEQVEIVNKQDPKSKRCADKKYVSIPPKGGQGWSPAFPATPAGVGGLALSDVLDASKGWLHEGALHVRCKMSIVVGTVTVGTSSVGEMTPQQEVCDALGSILASGSFADFVLRVSGERIDAHSVVLAARSPVFAAMFASPMREGRDKEVVIDDLEASAVRALLSFLYTGTVEVEVLRSDEPALALLQAAHRYEVSSLVERIAKALAARFDVNTVAEWLQVADLIGCKSFRSQCLEFMRQHMPEVQTTESFARLTSNRPAVLADIIAALVPPAKRRRK